MSVENCFGEKARMTMVRSFDSGRKPWTQSVCFLLVRSRPPRQELPDQMMEASDSPCSTNVKFGVSEAG